MKLKLRLGAVSALAMGAALAFPQGQPIQVTVNGTQVNFSGQGPIMRGDRVMVPLRGVLEQMGARVFWDPSTQTLTARQDRTKVSLTIGQTTASVNGSPVNLDVPALIVDGSTMVPLRFVTEALGGQVKWDPSDELVQITTGGDDYNLPPKNTIGDNRPHQDRPARPEAIAPIIFPAGVVFSVALNNDLSSENSTKGNTFRVTVQNESEGLPSGTEIHGYVAGARAANGDRPGMLELRFDQVIMPDGKRYPINGSLIGLDDQSVAHKGGRLVAKDTAPNRAAFTGYGAGAGLLVGLAGHRPVEDTAIGALLGTAIGALQKKQVHNVHIGSGTTFGVRLNSDLSIRPHDIK